MKYEFPPEVRGDIFDARGAGEPYARIAHMYGVSPSVVQRIVREEVERVRASNMAVCVAVRRELLRNAEEDLANATNDAAREHAEWNVYRHRRRLETYEVLGYA